MKYKCDVCEWIYNEETEGKKFDDQPDDYVCPICGAAKDMFTELSK